MPDHQFVLTLSCPDRPGIVSAVSTFLAHNGQNILDAQQFDDIETRKFFMRVVFAAADLAVELQALQTGFTAIADRLGMDWQMRDRANRRRVMLLVSKSDHCLVDILYRWRTGELEMIPTAIVSNHPRETYGNLDFGEIPFHHRGRACANPETGVRMNKAQAICVWSETMADRLNGYRILILETREEAQFSRLLTEQGADVLQCPMFTIHDVPDPAPVEAWIRRCTKRPFDDVVLMTGEGLRRLMKVVRRLDIEAEFVAALGQARKFARGPKPGRALREIGLEPQMTTEKPTSEGIAEMLSRVELRGHRLGLQLYPDKDHGVLIGAMKALGAEVDTVLPYAYDAQAADDNIIAAIDEMAAGCIDAIALTNLGQVRRLIEVARARGCEDRLREGFERTPIASVGPAVSDELKFHGLRTDIYPADDAFFMRPLISAMAAALGKNPPRKAARI